MTIALDASAAAKAERTGIARYVVRLSDALAEAAPERRFVLAYRLSRWRRRAHVHRPSHRNTEVRWFQEPWLRPTLGRVALFHGLDARLPRRLRCPAVVTVHDLAGAEAKDIQSERFRTRKRAHLAEALARADRVICVSNATASAVRRRFEVADDRLRVVHHGVDPRFAPVPEEEVRSTLVRLGVRRPYLLFVGLISARKNLVTLVEAFARIARERRDLTLLLCGGDGHGADAVDSAVRRLGLGDRVVRTGFVPDHLLPALLSGAELFVFPGLHEGFGLPILEAMACGTPVLAADTDAAAEVAGDAACTVSTRDPAVLAEALARLLADPDRRLDLAERGRLRTAAFTWSEAARRTLAVYGELLP